MKRILLIVAVLLGILIDTAFGQKPVVVTDNDPGWHKIGEITANFKMNEESIVVYGRDEFTKIKLKVVDAPINIEKIQLFFEEGSKQEIDLSSEMQAGGESRVIDLDGTNKELEKVSFTYKTLPNYKGDKATVELYGLKTRQDKSDAFRDNDRDDDNDVEEAAEKVDQEIDEESRELKQETREAREEVKEEAREAKQEWKEEKREAKEELKEERHDAKQEAKEVEKDVESGAEKTGDDISEAAVNAASHIKDKVYVDKVGPKGQTVYIDKHSKYYYVSDEGKKIYVTKAELKDKPKD